MNQPQSRGVEILRDNFGVAHVYGTDPEGLFFGFGYAQMEDYGDLVLKLYGESRGRAAEYWGEKYLENDRWVRLNEVPARADAWYRQQDPAFRRCLDAFAAGMNAYAERHPETLDLERRRVLPITGTDPIGHMQRIVHFTYMSSAAKVAAAAKAPGEASGGDTTVPGGSNGWAIAPSRSVTGRTLLLMNPHLPWGGWSTYYEINLVMPGLNLYGASQVGFPILRFVFSDILGFTQTVNNLRGSTLYRLSPEGGGYRFDGRVRPFESRDEILRVRQDDGTHRDVPLTILKSVHGPVVWNRDGVVLALRTAGLDCPFMAEQYWKMATAANFAEFQVQIARLQVPTFNIVYGDRDGHIMYLYNGAMPKHTEGDREFWAGLVPGDSSATLWTETHPYRDLPKAIDPPTGWLQNTNDPPWSCTYPSILNSSDHPSYFPAPGLTSFRTIRSLRILAEGGQFSFQDLVAHKYSSRLELADRILADLFAAVEDHGSPRARRAASVLRAWDRSAESSSRGTLLFLAFARKFLGPSLTSFSQFGETLDPGRPMETPRGLRDPAGAVRMLDSACEEVEARCGAADAPWGDFMRIQTGGADLPASGVDGNLGSFFVMRYGPIAAGDPREKVIFGDTFVACVEFCDPVRAEVLMTYGGSSQPGSPHQGDQLPLLVGKRLRPALRARADVEANLERGERF